MRYTLFATDARGGLGPQQYLILLRKAIILICNHYLFAIFDFFRNSRSCSGWYKRDRPSASFPNAGLITYIVVLTKLFWRVTTAILSRGTSTIFSSGQPNR